MKLKTLKTFIIFLILLSWFFSGFPQIWPLGKLGVNTIRIPPKMQVAYAFTSGTNNPGTSAGVGVVGGCTNAENWEGTGSPGNASAQDTSYIAVTGTKYDNGEKTDELRLSDFGFNISGTITGITVETLGWAPAGAANYTTVQLFTSPGTNVGNNKATGALPTSDPGTTYTTWGGTSDTWNAGLTAAQVNSSNFGVALCFTATADNTNINVDHVRITITYTNSAPSLTVSQPDGTSDTVIVGQSYNITYDLSDAEDAATVDFYYDSNGSGLDGTAITGCGDQAEGTAAICSWNTTGATPGDYYVYGIATDGVNPEVNDYSPGVITIQAAVVSVSVSDGIVTYGMIPVNTSKTTLSGELNDMQTATNDGNVTENFNIKSQDATGGGCTWTLASTNGNNQYVHQFCNDTDLDCSSPPTNYTALTTSYQSLKTGVAVSGTVNFQLRLTTPNPSSCYGQQSVNVTVQAVQQ